MTKIIGLSGWARSGKDSIADYLVQNHGYTKISFASPMKEALVLLDPQVLYHNTRIHLATAVRVVGWENLKDGSTDARELLQRMGTEVGRNLFGENFWVNLALEKAKHHDKVVISDCRFINEIEAIKNSGGSVWRINRENVTAVNNHISETELNNYKFDISISNNETLESLYALVEKELANV